MPSRVIYFLGVGTAGFVFDMTCLWFWIEICRLGPVPARLLAFAASICLTYVLNRSITFADRPSRGFEQAILYAIVSIAAGVANVATYIAMLHLLPPFRSAPYIALPVGVAVGMIINFTLYNFAVFRPRV